MIKKRVFSFLAALCLVGSSIPAAAASYDYHFENGYPKDYFYEPVNAVIYHDGHGNFSVPDSQKTVMSDNGYTSVILPPGVSSGGYIAGSTPQSGNLYQNVYDGIYPSYPAIWQGTQQGTVDTISGISTGDFIGTLSIPAIDLYCNVYEGETNANMAKGAGHFTSTSMWNGNVALSGHNRGSADYFGDLKYLAPGDTITYSTDRGTRTYRVTGVRQISVNDLSPLDPSVRNKLTLITCVENIASLRLCVEAEELW